MGERILLEMGSKREVGIWLLGTGWPVSGSFTGAGEAEKSRLRSAALRGKAAVARDAGRTRSPSYAPKINSLSLRMGPPAAAPNWFWINWGCFEGAKKLRAFRSWFRRNSQRAPWIRLVPERATTFITEPAVRPYSALKLLVSTLTSCSASGGG